MGCACRFPGKARAIADSVQAWNDLEKEHAQAFSNKLEAVFLCGRKHVPQNSILCSSDSNTITSTEGVAISPSRSIAKCSSAKRAVLVAR